MGKDAGAGSAPGRLPPERDEPPVLGRETELIAVCGFPGVGKSTVSERIADRLDARRLRTDAIRKELFEDPTYSTEESRTVYRTAFERASDVLAEDRTVVVDASFADRRKRDLARQVALECGVPFRLLRVECEEGIAVRRIEQREDISDADVDVYYAVREAFDPIGQDCIRIDNSGSREETRRQVDALLP